MGFTPKIKENILVASARHCCVCHRYKGVKIEIHHIIPKEQGGKDTFKNAIPLCFDCHSDAGHYFAKHPKGTKFSIKELKKHKESWFSIVEKNTIPLKNDNVIHSRYLITKEFDLLKEISNKNLNRFPIKNSLLLDNQALEQFRQITLKDSYRNLEIENILDIGPEDYSVKYKNAVKIPSQNNEYQHFYHERTPSKVDIENFSALDTISHYLLKNDIEPHKIAKILTCYQSECGCRRAFEELYILRPLYFKFLVITNISEKHIKLTSLDALENSGLLYDVEDIKNNKNIILPNILIEPNQSVIIPLGMFLAEYDDLFKSENYTRLSEIDGERSIVLDHITESKKEKIEYLGKNFQPKTLFINQGGQEIQQDIHNFDFNNVYWIDGFWNCGSCPHLFFKTNNNSLIYKGELFNKTPEVETIFSFITDNITKEIIIAELEYEITTITKITVNGKAIVADKKLKQNQEFRFSVSENDEVIIQGYYETKSVNFIELPIKEKANMIKKYKENYAQLWL
jgi:hypothetical protein